MDSNPAQKAHVKLLAFDFLSLTPTPSASSEPISFTRKGTRISWVEVVGSVVIRDSKPGKFLRFLVDDGTGCVPCILWLNQLSSRYFARRRPLDVRLIAQMTNLLSSRVQVGLLVRVRGRVSGFRGSVQITVEDVVVERDPNAELLHWLQCLQHAKSC